MNDNISSSFGLMIAYLLPGFVCLFGISLFSDDVAKMFGGFLTASSTVGLFLVVILASVTLGLILTVLRWMLFENIVCEKFKLEKSFFKAIGDNDKKLGAYRACVDELLRYHQFWGGMFWANFALIPGIIYKYHPSLKGGKFFLIIIISLLVEVILFIAAKKAFENYVCTAQNIMGGKECQMDGPKTG